MKIALNLFWIEQVGGILTYHKNLKSGLRHFGHNVDDYFISLNKKKLQKKYNSRGYIYTDFTDILGFEQDSWINNYKDIMDEYDIVIFTLPCPTLRSGASNKWIECYNISSKIISVFHDPYLNSRYPWIRSVYDNISKFVCVQEKSYITVRNSFGLNPPNGIVELIRHPMDLSDMGTYKEEKDDLIMTAQQFKSWKRVHLFIRAIPDIRKQFPNLQIEVYGGGIEMSKMSGKKRSEKYKDEKGWFWDNAVNAGMQYKGFVSDEELIEAYKRSRIFIDLSLGESGYKTHYPNINYSGLEAMKYGCIIIAANVLPPKLFTPNKNYLAVNEQNINESILNQINNIVSNNYEEMIRKNHEILKKSFDKQSVARNIIEGV